MEVEISKPEFNSVICHSVVLHAVLMEPFCGDRGRTAACGTGVKEAVNRGLWSDSRVVPWSMWIIAKEAKLEAESADQHGLTLSFPESDLGKLNHIAKALKRHICVITFRGTITWFSKVLRRRAIQFPELLKPVFKEDLSTYKPKSTQFIS